MIDAFRRSGMIAVATLRLLYLIQRILGVVLLLGWPASSKDVELLV